MPSEHWALLRFLGTRMTRSMPWVLMVLPWVIILTGSAFAMPAEVAEGVIHDFSPISAEIATLQRDFLILNVGAEHGVHPGDLFQIYGKGAPIAPPDSEGAVGFLNRPMAVVQVEHVEPRTALCRVISGKGPFRIGQPAARYSDMAAAVQGDVDGDALAQWRQGLVDALPGLIWQESSDVPFTIQDAPSMELLGISLLFAFDPLRLRVYGPDLALVHEYVWSASAGDAVPSTAFGSREAHKAEKPAPGDAPSFRFPDDMILPRNALMLGLLPEEVIQAEVADLDLDGRYEVVYLTASGLSISPYRTRGPSISYPLHGPGMPICFSLQRGSGWIAVNVCLSGTSMRSVVLRYEAAYLREVHRDINLWLAFVDRDGSGVPETLIGQTFDAEHSLGTSVYFLNPAAPVLEYRQQVTMPEEFSLLGAYWADFNGNGVPEMLATDFSGRIRVYEKGRMLWSTTDPVLETEPKLGFSKRALLILSSKDGLPYLLLATARKEVRPRAGERLVVFAWQAGAYVIAPVSESLGAPVAGLSLVQDELIVGVSREIPGQAGMKGLLYSLGRLSRR